MAFTQTNNFGLNKDDGTEFYDVEKINENTDIIDTVLGNTAKYEKAGGTSTAIILTGVILEDGISKTFIASANNGGAATTINAKSLYKPGTTTVPNLIAGKAYTVWYDLTGDCFFLKASAEGDAVAANVLAGKKFSNDSDTGIEGEMPNNGAVVVTPGTTDKPITKGYHDGNGYVQGDADLISSNIKADANIFGVPGSPMVMDTSAGDAVAGDMLAGKKACVGGAVVTGTMANRSFAANGGNYTSALSVKADGGGTICFEPPTGYYEAGVNGMGFGSLAKYDPNFIAENIASGKSIFGLVGTMSAGKKFASGTATSKSSDGNILYLSAGGNSAAYCIVIEVTGLAFTPSVVLAHRGITPDGSNRAAMTTTLFADRPTAMLGEGYHYDKGRGTGDSVVGIKPNGFYLPVVPMLGMGEEPGQTYTWYAWE